MDLKSTANNLTLEELLHSETLLEVWLQLGQCECGSPDTHRRAAAVILVLQGSKGFGSHSMSSQAQQP